MGFLRISQFHNSAMQRSLIPTTSYAVYRQPLICYTHVRLTNSAVDFSLQKLN